MRTSKGLKTITANGKPITDKLTLTSTKLAIRIKQDIRAKKVFTLKTS